MSTQPERSAASPAVLTPSPSPSPAPSDDAPRPPLSRRGFLRAAAVSGGGLVAATIAACAPAGGAPTWTYGPASDATLAPPTATPSMDHSSPTPSGSPGPSQPAASIPPGWSEHDVAAKSKVERFLAGEYDAVEGKGNQPLEPRIEADGTKVFELTVDEIEHRIDAQANPLEALGFNRTWPGPLIRVTDGDRLRIHVRNNLTETTGIHWHGQRVPNAMDGVPMITQDPIVPGETFTYEFVARPAGSHMYHSHHNATDQVGRGLLGALIVDPADPAERYAEKYGVTQDIVWISNDALGGFTINGRGFPATAPIVARLGEKIVVRFMNEGLMMHPWHLHGMTMRVIARDGFPLGGAEFTCDTLGVNPGERWDVLIDCDAPGAWAFHCHVLTHAEGLNGMFGMVTALVVTDGTTASLPAATVASARAASVERPFGCNVPILG